MLRLGIKPGEYVQIGEDIKVCVIQAKGGVLKLGVEAPREYEILRDKVIEKREAEGAEAAPC